MKTGGKSAGCHGRGAARRKLGQGKAQRPSRLCRLQAGLRQADRLAVDRHRASIRPRREQRFEARGEPGDVELPLAEHAVATRGDLADDGTRTRHTAERVADGIAPCVALLLARGVRCRRPALDVEQPKLGRLLAMQLCLDLPGEQCRRLQIAGFRWWCNRYRPKRHTNPVPWTRQGQRREGARRAGGIAQPQQHRRHTAAQRGIDQRSTQGVVIGRCDQAAQLAPHEAFRRLAEARLEGAGRPGDAGIMGDFHQQLCGGEGEGQQAVARYGGVGGSGVGHSTCPAWCRQRRPEPLTRDEFLLRTCNATHACWNGGDAGRPASAALHARYAAFEGVKPRINMDTTDAIRGFD
jgi:hypothetical protein